MTAVDMAATGAPDQRTPEREPVGPLGQAAWTLTEWANEPFFALVTRYVFASYFANVMAPDAVTGQAMWGYAQGIAGFLVALASPVLGAMADAAGPRKPWLFGCATVCAIASCLLWWAEPGQPLWPVVMVVAVATAGAEFCVVFINSFLASIASRRRMGLLSGIGFGMSQLAGIIALLAMLFLIQGPEQPAFGLDRATHEHDRISGPIAGVWFILFVLPLMLLTPDIPASGLTRRQAVRKGLGTIVRTVRELPRYRNILVFLVARMTSTDGTNIVFAFGGILAGSLFGWTGGQLALFGVVVTVFSTLGGFLGGWADMRFGSRRVVLGGLVVILITTIGILTTGPGRIWLVPVAPAAAGAPAFSTLPEWVFTVTACALGLAAGPVIASMRTLMARIAPLPMMTEFFGLYALAGKATNFAGPLMVGALTALSGSLQVGMLTAVAMLAVGIALLCFVREERAEIHP